ncbi:hypothetical protein HNY73_011558, partial [Argiope bruennichi]
MRNAVLRHRSPRHSGRYESASTDWGKNPRIVVAEGEALIGTILSSRENCVDPKETLV